MSRYGFIPHAQCSSLSGDCFRESRCLNKCNPRELHGLSSEQLLVVAAKAARRECGETSRRAKAIDELTAKLRRGGI